MQPVEIFTPILDPTQAETPTNPDDKKNEMWMLATFDGIETPEGDQTAIDTVRSVLTSLASDLAVAFKDRNIDDLLDKIISYLNDGNSFDYTFIQLYGAELNRRFHLGQDLIRLRQKGGNPYPYNDEEMASLKDWIEQTTKLQLPSVVFMESLTNAHSQLPCVKATIVDSIALKNSLKTAVLQQQSLGGRESQVGIAHME